jgi:triosephosphate isomerase
MYLDRSRAHRLFEAVQAGLQARFPSGEPPISVILCPSFVSIESLHGAMDPRVVALGAQDCHWESSGPFTGEVSAAMLHGLVDYVMVGHGERRATGERDEEVAKKVAAVAGAGLTPILFVGEDQPTDSALERTEERLTRGLGHVEPSKQRVLVVYEPTWAIGADDAASAEHVSGVVQQLKERLRRLGSSEPRVIYGGTVNRDNVERFARLEELDGVGATRAGLDPDGFLHIVDRVAEAAA